MSLVVDREDGLDITGAVNITDINHVIKNLVANDGMMSQNSNAPKIWECKWYNVDKQNISGYGYDIGQAVWLNTDDIDEFVLAKENDIRTYALGNDKTAYLINQLSGNQNRQKLIQLYKDIVNGENGFDRLYFLGSLTDDVQIKVSISANNTELPTLSTHWIDFIDRTKTSDYFKGQILSVFNDKKTSLFGSHNEEYHLCSLVGSCGKYDTDEYLSRFVRNDLSNIRSIQKFKSHTYTMTTEGVDYVKQYVTRTYGDGFVKWFRTWNSGLLEHGGIVNASNPSKTGDTSRYGGKFYQVNFDFDYNGKKAPIYNFPNITFGSFYYSDTKIDAKNGQGQFTYTNENNALGNDYRYQISLTRLGMANGEVPYSKKNSQSGDQTYYETTDVTNMTNSSFSFNIGNGIKFSYYVRGFRQEN